MFPSLCGLEFVKVFKFRKLGGVGQGGGNWSSNRAYTQTLRSKSRWEMLTVSSGIYCTSV